jgi:hypothetical protein
MFVNRVSFNSHVKANKNEANDAEAICQACIALQHPFVVVKTLPYLLKGAKNALNCDFRLLLNGFARVTSTGRSSY